MNLTIWKIVLRPTNVQQIKVPAGAELLCAREQHEQICIWFRCDPTAQPEMRTIAIVGTGHPAPGNDGRYLGTASLLGGDLMFHVFEQVSLITNTLTADDETGEVLRYADVFTSNVPATETKTGVVRFEIYEM